MLGEAVIATIFLTRVGGQVWNHPENGVSNFLPHTEKHPVRLFPVQVILHDILPHVQPGKTGTAGGTKSISTKRWA
jgi:hypothetical protein